MMTMFCGCIVTQHDVTGYINIHACEDHKKVMQNAKDKGYSFSVSFNKDFTEMRLRSEANN